MKNLTMALCAMLAITACPTDGAQEQASPALTKKLHSIIIPRIEFRYAKLAEVIDFLVFAAQERDPDKKGVNIVLMDKANTSEITLSLKNVSLHKALGFIAKMADLRIDLEGEVVVLRNSKDKTR